MMQLKETSSRPQVSDTITALHILVKLHKAKRTHLKRQARLLQRQWQSLQPLNAAQQQQLQKLSQKQQEHQAAVDASLAQLVDWLQQVGLRSRWLTSCHGLCS